MKTPFLGGSYSHFSRELAANEAINCRLEMVDTDEGTEPGAMIGTPGYDLLANTVVGPWRGLRNMAGVLYGVQGNNFGWISSSWVFTTIGQLLTSTGFVEMIDNGTQIGMADGVNLYGFDSSNNNFSQVVLPFSQGGALSLSFQDSFFIVNETGTNNWWQSDPNNIFSIQGLDFASAASQPGNVQALQDCKREVVVFKQFTSDFWYNAGIAGFVFTQVQGVFMEVGCIAPQSPANIVMKDGNTCVCWLGQSEGGGAMVYRTEGYLPHRISHHAMEYEIQQYATCADAIGFRIQDAGHESYWLVFPTAGTVWVWDATSGFWHKRAYLANGVLTRDRLGCFAQCYGRLVVGDFANGNLYGINPTNYTHFGTPMKSIRRWRALAKGQDNYKRMRFQRLQILLKGGVGNNTGQGSNPVGCLRYSDAGGPWSNEHYEPIGQLGDGQWVCVFDQLGVGRDRVFEFSMTDPVPRVWVGAELTATPMRS